MAEMTNPNLSYEKVESMKGFWTVALFSAWIAVTIPWVREITRT